jgi:hypothetical protein
MDEQLLQHQVQAFIRQFGLFEHEHTPCNFPLSPSQAHALQVLGQQGGFAMEFRKDLSHLSWEEVFARQQQRAALVSKLATLLPKGGWAVIAEFHPDGPGLEGPPRVYRLLPQWIEA